MALQKKADKKRVYNFFGFNIKLLSNLRHGDLAYQMLIEELYKKDVVGRISNEKAMTLRNQFVKRIVWKDIPYNIIYGKLTRFTLLEGDNWYNRTTHEFERAEIPLNVFPNGFETDYFFIPAAHRFFIRIHPKVGVYSTERFLTRALKEVILQEEDFSVHIIQSEDAIEKILNAVELQYLKVNVSYTNDDIGKEAQELIDDLLKEGNIGEFNATLKPDQQGSLDTQSSLVKGLLEISKENGTAEATIKNAFGKREKIITYDHPEKISIVSEEDDIVSQIFFKIIQTYRDGRTD